MDKMREEFEAWFSAEDGALPQQDGDGGYYYTPANDMWQAWQASRATLCVKLPDSVDFCGDLFIPDGGVTNALDYAGVS